MLVCSEGKQLWGKLQGLQLEMLMGWVGDWPASTYPLRGNGCLLAFKKSVLFHWRF